MIANVNKFKGFKSLGGYGCQRQTCLETAGYQKQDITSGADYKEDPKDFKETQNLKSDVLKSRAILKKRFEKDKEIEYDLSEKHKQYFVPLIAEQKELIKPFQEKLKLEEEELDRVKAEGTLDSSFNPIDYVISITDRSLAPYSLKYNKNSNTYSFGDSAVIFNNNYNEIILKDKTYQTTPGLMELLTKKSPNTKICTINDKNNYKEMLMKTNALFHNYDPESKKFNADKSDKWKLIRHTLLPGMFKTKAKPKKEKVKQQRPAEPQLNL